ncbi:MAG TPA: hypothetical protein HPP97_10945, partial [Desulfuromonadales bacterium]|nr:hypothetical protein [Desulfuromonadales bacterium]
MRNTRWLRLFMAALAFLPFIHLGSSDASAASPGYAIVVPANVSFDPDGSADYFKTGNRVKQSLAQRGITDITSIYTGKSSLQNAIQVWARDKMNADPAPLYIVVINHGSVDQFYLGNETVTAAEMNSWLETLEANITPAAQLQKRVVIFGFCYSGTFIKNLSRSGRIVISSSAPDEESYRGPAEPDGVRGGEYFIEQLFAELGRGVTLKKAFSAATASVRAYLPDPAIDLVSQYLPFYLDGAVQHPLLDDDGDGIGSNSFSDDTGDGLIAGTLTLGTLPPCSPNTSGCPAAISNVSETLFLDENSTTAPVWVKSSDDYRTRWVINENTGMLYNSATGAWEENVAIDPGMNVQSYHLIENNAYLSISPLRTSVVYRALAGNNPPAPFGLTEPLSGSTRPGVLALRWEDAVDPDGDAVTYTLLLSRSSSFSTIDLKRELLLYPAFGIDATAGLQSGATYYWKVQAVDAYGSITESSQTGSVTIDNSGGIPALVEGHALSLYSGLPVVGASVWSSAGSSTTTAANGYFVFTTQSGNTSVSTSASGFVQATRNIVTRPGDKTELRIPLEPAVRPTLTVNFKGPGFGTVESIPAGIFCSTGNSCSGAATAPNMKLVVSTSTPHTILSRWEGGCYSSGDCTIQMTADKTVTAIFAAAPGAMTTSSTSFGDTWAEFSGLVNTNELTSESRFAHRLLPSGTWLYTSWLSVNYGSFGSFWAPVRSTVSGLLPLGTYEYRIEARNAQGSTSSTTTATVTLKGSAPYASTGTISNLTSTGVTIAGSVTPRGNNTTYWFEYGTSTSYGSATPQLSAGSDLTATVSVSTVLSGLLPSTTYFYRTVASNQYGTAYGSSGSFYTPYTGALTGFGLVKDIYPGTSSSSPKALIEYNNVLYFSADSMDPAPTYTWYNRELMRSDGTLDGTFLVKDISPGGSGFDPTGMIKIGGYLYFTGSWPTSIYRTDGTSTGTIGVFSSPHSVSSLTPSGDRLFFQDYDINWAGRLWVTSGTTNTLVTSGLSISTISPWNQGIFMNVQTVAEGTELWKSDGTTAGTVMVKDINPGTASSSPSQVVQVGTTWLFSADNGVNGKELWRTDGTAAGTVMVKDICPGTCSSMYDTIKVMYGIAYFWASDGVSGYELWRSDGTEAGTWLVKDIYPGAYSSMPYEVIVENNLLFFNAEIPGTGRELWRSDGTAEGTFMLKDIHPVSTAMYIYPTGMRGVYGKVYFQGNDGISGNEIWVTDGTPAGTTLLRDIYPGSGSSNPTGFTGVAGNLYFAATAPGTGTELYYQALTTYSVTPSAGPNGRINPGSGLILSEGVSGRFSVNPDPGYRIASVSGCGGSMSGNIYITAPLTASCAINASFEPDTFQVTLTAGLHGSITGLTVVPRNAQPTYSITPDTGYHVVDVTVNGASVGVVTSYTFPTGIAANTTISATFAINTYSIAVAAGPNGTISGPTAVTYGETASYTITPASGYHIAEVLVDGINTGALSSYSFGPVSADHTITASFAINSYTVTLTAGVGGSISGPTVVNHGDLPTYTITPNSGYRTTQVRVDNAYIGVVSSYTFTIPVTAPKTITAYFAINTYPMTVTTGSGGSITGPRSVNHGTTAVYSITPISGYQVADVLVDGVSVGPITSYTFSSVSQPHTISASFTISSYTIALDAGPGGSIIGPTKVVFGNNPTFTITPDTGYSIADVAVDGTSIGPVNGYTLPKVIAVDNGSNHTLVLLSDGSVWTYGANPFGQIGNGTSGTNIFTPFRVNGLPEISAVAGGGGHSVALAKDGTVWTWGLNMYGQLGIGSTVNSPVPAKVSGLNGVVAISAGMHHVMALKNDGTVWAWGNNSGSLGNGTLTGSLVPVQMIGLSGITAVSAGAIHSVALKNDGTVWACGYNNYGEVGNGTTTSVYTPVQVPNVSGVTAISAGQYITMILKNDGTAWAWGSNYDGELGNGTNVRSLVPVQPTGLADVKAIAAGSSHSMAVKKDGTVWAWGSNLDGQLGDGTTTNRLAPVQVNGLSGFISVRGGAWYSTALKDDATLRGWGQNAYGQLGIGGSAINFPTPVQSAIGVITADKTISARFTINSYTISATADSNGTITGPATATYYSNATYAITPNSGYYIAGVTVDGVAVGAVASYTFSSISANHSISATFAINVYTITASAGSGGSIIGPATATYNSSATYTITPSAGYYIAGVTVDGVAVGAVASYTFTNVTANHTIAATFAVNTYAFSATAGTHGTMYGPATIVSGGMGIFVIVPDNGYQVADVLVDNISVGAVSRYIFTNVTAPHSISASFIPRTLAVTDVSPKPDAVDVPFSSSVSAQFNASLTQSTLTPASFTLSRIAKPVQIAAGDYHTLVRTSDGAVMAWGYNAYGQSTVPAGLTDVASIAAGSWHSVAVKKNGTVTIWGNNAYGQSTVPAGLSGVVAAAAGFVHTVALKSDGTVIAWGSNQYGVTSIPAGLTGVVAVAAGTNHTVALKSDGTVVTWGYNGNGQLAVPAGLTGVVAIAAGYTHTVALKSDGTVVAWGGNISGQSTVPVGLTGVVAITANGDHTVALKSDGSLVAWGFNYDGQASAPKMTGISAIVAGGFHTVAMKNDGSLLSWGNNAFGQTTIPTALSGGVKGVVAIAAGDQHSVAVTADGAISVWGNNQSNQATIPGSAMGGINMVASNGTRTTVLKSDGAVVEWGNTHPNKAPAGLSGVVSLATGFAHTVAVKTDGTVTAWGSNSDGQTSVPIGLSGVVAVAAGYNQTLALKYDGTVTAWGNNAYGQGAVPAGLSGVSAITSGGGFNVALKTDGTVTAWGSNLSGEITVPGGLANVIAIATGAYHTLALKSDGTVVAWGYNGSGQTTVPAGLTGVVAIAAGSSHSLALKADGTVLAWGYNGYGQTDVPQLAAAMKIPGTLIWNEATLTATITPLAPLPVGATLTASLSGIVTSVSGARMAGDYTWRFTTPNHYNIITNSVGSGTLACTPAAPLPGATAICTATPAAGYHMGDVIVDGTSVGAAASYTFTAVAANHTIAATFAIDSFTVTATSGANGSVTGPATASYGSNATFSITPAAGYHVADVLVDGVSVGAVSGYTFTNVTANHSISAT